VDRNYKEKKIPTKEGTENGGSSESVMVGERKNKWKENEIREEEIRSNNRKRKDRLKQRT